MPILLPLKEAQVLSGLARNTIRNWIEDGKLTKYNENGTKKQLVDKLELLDMIPTTFCICNEKGGPGKTSISCILADYYEKKNKKILLIDFDKQANLTKSFFKNQELYTKEEKEIINEMPEKKHIPSLYEFFERNTNPFKIVKKYNDNINVLTSDRRLRSQQDKYDIDDLEKIKLNILPIIKRHQIVIIDCPPDFNSLTKFGLMLSNYVIIPVVPEPYSYDGLADFIKSITYLIKYMNNFIDFRIVFNAHDKRGLVIQKEYINLIKEQLKDKVFINPDEPEQNISIPDFVGVKERGIEYKNIFDMYPVNKEKATKSIKILFDMLNEEVFDKRGI